MTGVALDRPLGEQQEALQLLLDLEGTGAADRVSLTLTDPNLPYDTYEALGAFLGEIRRRSIWYLGDWLNFGEGVYGERFVQAEAATGLTEDTLLRYQFVCRQVPAARRIPGMSFGTHAVVARMEPLEQKQWLKEAKKRGWNERDLRKAIAAKRSEMKPSLPGLGDYDPKLVTEVAQAILRDARPAEDGQHYLVSNENIVRLRAAFGSEDE